MCGVPAHQVVQGAVDRRGVQPLNHANYGSYNTTLSATNAATTALFGTPAQNTNNAYVPRMAQLAFRLAS